MLSISYWILVIPLYLYLIYGAIWALKQLKIRENEIRNFKEYKKSINDPFSIFPASSSYCG